MSVIASCDNIRSWDINYFYIHHSWNSLLSSLNLIFKSAHSLYFLLQNNHTTTTFFHQCYEKIGNHQQHIISFIIGLHPHFRECQAIKIMFQTYQLSKFSSFPIQAYIYIHTHIKLRFLFISRLWLSL